MIHSITVTNHLNQSLSLDLRSPEQSGLYVKSIDGLGSPKANINLTEVATFDGSIYNSGRAEFRNILVTLGFLFNPDIETMRQKTYKYFPLKRRIKFEIETDNRNCYVYGYVESNEPNIFSKDGDTIISIICPDAYLYDVNPQSTVFSSLSPLFEFPFSNESLVSPLIQFGSITYNTIKTVLYEGDAPVGMLLIIHASGSASNVDIINTETLDSIEIDSTILATLTGSDIIEGDDIIISTVRGNKYAKLVRGSTEYNILGALNTDRVWFQLEKGDNVFAYTATSGLSNLTFKIENEIAYEGI